MYKVLLPTFVALSMTTVPLAAQEFQRRAALVGGANANSGRCTAEVVVDNSAEVALNGDMGTLRDLAGQPPQWRRFECTGPMPANPADVRFRGLNGRGRMQLVRDPRNGGPAVVRIEDPEDGAATYAFEIEWTGGPGPGNLAYAPGERRDRDEDRRYGGQAPADRAVDACRDQVRRQSAERFGTPEIDFQDIHIDNDRNNWIVGAFFLRRDRDRDQPHRFACQLDPDRDQVRSVAIDPEGPPNSSGYANRTADRDAVQTCRREVDRRVRQNGYSDVTFRSINLDPQSSRVVGTLSADRGMGSEPFDFSCGVDLRDGDVRSVDVNRR